MHINETSDALIQRTLSFLYNFVHSFRASPGQGFCYMYAHARLVFSHLQSPTIHDSNIMCHPPCLIPQGPEFSPSSFERCPSLGNTLRHTAERVPFPI